MVSHRQVTKLKGPKGHICRHKAEYRDTHFSLQFPVQTYQVIAILIVIKSGIEIHIDRDNTLSGSPIVRDPFTHLSIEYVSPSGIR